LTAVFASSAQATGTYFSYSANGGTGAPAKQAYLTKNTYVNLSMQEPVRVGYTFLGWHTSASAKVPLYQPGEAVLVTKTMCLYAVWEADPATINVVHKDNMTGEILKQVTYTVTPSVKYGPYTAESFVGYCAGKLATGSAAATITPKPGTVHTITYAYNKFPTVTVTHRDNASGEILKQDVYSVAPGKYGPYLAETFSGYLAGKLVVGSTAASGTIVEGKPITITYGYDKVPMITVRHVDADTGDLLREDEYTVSAGVYGPYRAEVFADYLTGSLATGSAPASGTIGVGRHLIITYQYRKSTATINVFHRDRDTNALLRQDTHIVNAGLYGPYNADTFAGYGPGSLGTGSVQPSGTISNGQTLSIIYLYQKAPNKGTVNVIHRDRETNAILREDNYSVDAGNYGPYNAMTFAGYQAGTLAAYSAPATGTVGANQSVTVTYLYSKTPATATINYVHRDRDTNATLRHDVLTVPAGSYGPYNALTFAGYQAGTLAPGSGAPSGTIAAGQTINILYLYSKTPATATIVYEHLDFDTHAVLRRDTLTVNAGSYGPYNAMTFTGYDAGILAAGSAPASGNIAAGQTLTITYLYKKAVANATIIVEHRDQDTRAVLRSDTYTVPAGNYGPYTAMTFAGYGPGSWVAGSDPVSGTIAGGQTRTITFRYTKTNQNATIIVEHRDQDTRAVLRSDTYTVPAGSYGPYTAMTFTGYGPGSWVASSDPVSGTIAGGQTRTITFRYVKTTQQTATINVEHRDRDTNAILNRYSFTVNAGSYGPYNAEIFVDYESGTLANGSAPASGTIAGGQTITITYLYSRSIPLPKATIVVQHVYHLTHEPIKMQDTYTINAGAYGPYNPANIPGYVFLHWVSDSAPQSGTIGANQVFIITLCYIKDTDPVPGSGASHKLEGFEIVYDEPSIYTQEKVEDVTFTTTQPNTDDANEDAGFVFE